MIRRILIILFILYMSLVNAESIPEPLVGQKIKKITLDGNILSGNVKSVNSDEISLTTDFGTISIKQQKIEFVYN